MRGGTGKRAVAFCHASAQRLRGARRRAGDGRPRRHGHVGCCTATARVGDSLGPRRDTGAAPNVRPRRRAPHLRTSDVVGLLGALMLGRLAASVLVDTAPHDAVSLGGAAVLTVIAGMTACLLPAHRAAVTDPATALRE